MQARPRSRWRQLPVALMVLGCLLSCGAISLNLVLVSQSLATVSEAGQPPDVKAERLREAVERQVTVQRATRFATPGGAALVALGVALLVVRRRRKDSAAP